MAAKRKKSSSKSTSKAVGSSSPMNHCCPGWHKPTWFLWGVFLLVLGVLLWRGYAFERIFSVLLAVTGLKMVVLSLLRH